MSNVFDGIEITQQKPEDFLSAGYVSYLPSNIYNGTIKFVKFVKHNDSDNKGISLTVIYDVNGNEYTDYLNVVNKFGKNVNDKGYVIKDWKIFEDLMYFADGSDPVKGTKTEKKIIKEYDFDTGQDRAVERDVISNLINKPVKLALLHIKANKNKKIGDEWVKLDEVKDKNKIDAVFDPVTSSSRAEKLNKVAPEFHLKWLEKNKDRVQDSYKKLEETPITEVSSGSSASEKSDTPTSNPWA